jgi:hypothetical protein
LHRFRQRDRVRGIEIRRQPVLGGGARQLILRFELARALEMCGRRFIARWTRSVPRPDSPSARRK